MMRFRRLSEPKPPSKREQFLAVLEESLEAASRAEEALEAGKPLDCPEVREAQRLMHVVNTHPYQSVMRTRWMQL